MTYRGLSAFMFGSLSLGPLLLDMKENLDNAFSSVELPLHCDLDPRNREGLAGWL